MTSLVIPKEKSAKTCRYAFFPGEPSKWDLLREEFYTNWESSHCFPDCSSYDECKAYVDSVDKACERYEKSRKHLTGMNADFVTENNVFLFGHSFIREAIFWYSYHLKPRYTREPFAVMVARLVEKILSLDGVYDEEEDRIYEYMIHPIHIPMCVNWANKEE